MTEPTHPHELPPECAQTRERLARDVDAQLDHSERDAVQLHLQGCEGCAEIAGWIRDVDGIAAATETPPLPEPAYFGALSERVLHELGSDEPAPTPRPWAGWLRWAPSLVAFAAVAMIVGVISRRQIQETPQLETVANRPIETMARSTEASPDGAEKPTSAVGDEETVLEAENETQPTSPPADEFRAPALSRQESEGKKIAASPPPEDRVYLREQSPAPAADAGRWRTLSREPPRGGREEVAEEVSALGTIDAPAEAAPEKETAVALDDQRVDGMASGALEIAGDSSAIAGESNASPDELRALLAEGQSLALLAKTTPAMLSRNEEFDANDGDTLGKNEERAGAPRSLDDVAADILAALRDPSAQPVARADQPAAVPTQLRDAATAGRRRAVLRQSADRRLNEPTAVPSLEDSLAVFLRAELNSIRDAELRAVLSAWLEERERE